MYKCFKINKPTKAPGPSSVPAWALKDEKTQLHKPLTFLINRFFYEERFPTDLKRAIIIRLYKKGSPEDPENNRSIISVTGALSKVFERCLYNQIEECMLNEKLYNELQFGFRKRTTTEALIYFTEKIRKEINKKFVSTAYIDIFKAFDSISHEILYSKLKCLGFNENAVLLIKSFTQGRIQKTIVNNLESDWLSPYNGVPQWTVLGQLLFNLYINDIKQIKTFEFDLLQYADDTVILCCDHSLEKASKRLENAIHEVSKYFGQHKLNLNAKKTRVFSFFSQTSKPINSEAVNQSSKRNYSS